MEREYTIQELIGIFFKKLWLIILLSVVGLLIGFGISKFLITPQYSSSVSMYIYNSNSIENSINYTDLTASKQLVNTYIVILQDDTIMKQVVTSLNKKYSIEEMEELFGISSKNTVNNNEDTVGILGTSSGYSENSDIITILSKCIKNSLSMSALNDTEVLNITATTSSAQFSADICNTISNIAPAVLIRVTKAGSVQTIGSAEPALLPSSPNVSKNSIMGFGIGFVISVVIVFLLDLFDTTLKNANVLTENFGLVNLGQVSDISSNKDKKQLKNNDIRKTHTILDKNIPFYFIEAFKLIRTNIMFSMSTTNNNIFAISSSGAGEGKSLISSNVAISLAQTGKKVLIVDCDLRKPVQHKVFKLKNKIGISQYIGKMATLDDIIQHDILENLDVITSGIIPPNPSEMLASENMKQFLKEVSSLYDYVIVDTPPVTVVSDVIGLSNDIAGLIFVARCQHTKYNDISKAMETFKISNMNILGFVLNGGDDMYGKYGKYGKYSKYGRYYKSYGSYEYHQDDGKNNDDNS